jgi:hypothetical protein
LSGYSLRDLFKPKEAIEQPVLTSQPAPDVRTRGDNSPAVITSGGDVNINYGDPKPKADSTNKQ